jgi:hypothetical protein
MRSVTIFTSPTESATFAADHEITAGDRIPGFSVRVGDLFDVPTPPEPQP